MKRKVVYVLTVILILTALLVPAALLAQGPAPEPQDTPAGTPFGWDPSGELTRRFERRDGPARVMIILEEPSTVEVFLDAREQGPQLQARAAARTQLARVEAAQQQAVSAVQVVDPSARVIFRVQRILNGVAAQVDAAKLDAIGKLPGVQAIYPLVPHRLAHSGSVPLIGAPELWDPGNLGVTGEGMRIGIIDSGLDYIHTNFGGPGTPGAYAANDSTVITDTYQGALLFPTAKVVGGWDFIGDHYDPFGPDPALWFPHPDPDPMDCPTVFGHGTHVAGTAAGAGVNADGTTYEGPYDAALPFANFRIAPGVAPEALLYALRVISCEDNSETDIVAAGIDWAVDPDGDGDPSDHLDVINMSLGFWPGGPYDPVALASDRAAQLGVVVVAAAGNSGDIYYFTASPSVSDRTISVAASVDALSIVGAYKVDSPPEIAGLKPASFSGNFNWAESPPVTGEVVYVPENRFGCAPFDPAAVGGRIVLVDWADAGSTAFPCGSFTRATNASNAGAIGIIMREGVDRFMTAIAGNEAIPAVYTLFSAGEELKSAMADGPVTVTLSAEFRNSVRFESPEDEDTIAFFSSRGPRRGDSFLKPDISAPGLTVFSADAFTGSEGTSGGGTSMAAPHVAGAMALLRQIHPDWSVEELKALVMNTAIHDLFTGLNRTGAPHGPGRVGAGRLDVANAAMPQVIAYNAEDEGLVSLSFGAIEVLAGNIMTLEKQVTVANKGTVAATYQIGYDPRVTMQGVSYSVSPEAITVPAGGIATLTVTLAADPAQMRRDGRDPGAAAIGPSGLPRHWLNEAAGYLTLSPSPEGASLRLPVHSAPRLAAEMHAEQATLALGAEPTGVGSITLRGQGVATAPLEMFGTPEGMHEDFSIVTAFELQDISDPASIPEDVPLAVAADLQAVGITSNLHLAGSVGDSSLYFGIGAYGEWTMPYEVLFYIWIDTDDSGIIMPGDGSVQGAEFLLWNDILDGTDVWVTLLANLTSGATYPVDFVNVYPANINTNPIRNSVVVMAVPVAELGLDDTQTSINYAVQSLHFDQFILDWVGLIDESRVMSYNIAQPGLVFEEVANLDLDGETLEFTYDRERMAATSSLGALLLHHHNTAGNRVEVLLADEPTTITMQSLAAESIAQQQSLLLLGVVGLISTLSILAWRRRRVA
jgi:subtilisin family serine protease